MLTSIRPRRLAWRPPLRVVIVAALTAALVGGLLHNTAPAHKAAATPNIAAVCVQSTDAAVAAYRTQAAATGGGPLAHDASYTSAQSQAFLHSSRQQAIAKCEGKLKATVKQAGYNYLVSSLVQIAVENAVAFLTMTFICAYNFITCPVGVKIGGLGYQAVQYVQNASDYIYNNFIQYMSSFSGVDYQGGRSIKPVLDSSGGAPVANSVQIRDIGNAPDVYGSNDNTYDLHSSNGNPYYNWDVEALINVSNDDGAQGYLIAQGNYCLTHDDTTYSSVYGTPCNVNDYHQWWFVDGTELMATNGKCINQTNSAMWLSDCDGLNYYDNPSAHDDQFMITVPIGSAIPANIDMWQNDWKVYMGAS